MISRHFRKTDCHEPAESFFRFRRAALLGVLCLVLVFGAGGCGLFSWFSKKDIPEQNKSIAEKIDAVPPETKDVVDKKSGVDVSGTHESETAATGFSDNEKVEGRPRDLPDGPVVSRENEAANSESTPKAESLSAKVKAQNISKAEDRLFQMEQIGNDLGLKFFLDRLESNVGRLTYKEIVSLWGPPQDLQDQDYIVTAVWRWRTSKVADHGEMITLLFDRGRGLLLGWQYGKW